MKKEYLIIIAIVIIGCFLSSTLQPNQWDVFVYSLLALFLVFNAGEELFVILKTRNGVYAEGYVRAIEHVEESEGTKEVIEFISPADNETYQIKNVNRGMIDLSTRSSGKVKVWVNLKNPMKSLVVKKFDSLAFVSLGGKLIFVIFFVIMIIVSW